MARREGRGRLHTIDRLPAAADDAIRWATGELAARKLTQQDILAGLNERLAAAGCPPLSSSSFNRFSMRKAAALRNLAELSAVGNAVAAALPGDKSDEVTVLIAQMIKEGAYNLLERGDVTSKSLMEIGRALTAANAALQKSAQLKADYLAIADKGAAAAADKLCEGRPELDRAEVLRRIREEVYGMFEAAGDAGGAR